MVLETKKERIIRKETFNALFSDSRSLPELLFETPEEAAGSIAAMMRGFWKYVDDCVEQEVPKNTQTCKKGCSYCCSQPIFMDIFEAVACIHYMEGEDIVTAFEQGFPRWQKNFAPQQPILWKALQEDKWDELGALAKKLNAPCPFLLNNECACYEARPMVCRTWVSKTFRFLCRINSSSVKYTLKCQDEVHDAYNRVLLHIATAFEIPLAAGGWTTLPLAYNSVEGNAAELLKHAIAKHITYSR
ncbi:YkgJ family cysteine cluster protein [Halodesulfovibrio marinisediminis]|uniref:Putative zinc-or iron-chelating domain-containing protein n=1 Tax=Halodesulfovibrio marinisediminis DSM 17456 TaxID=1121457 RepID=A0A1N6IK20_9BACT|nr:YkgJ family cysteine cluster protein [Halodesulfovibrio marinisediminis]SIO32388.1 Putative zinc-or iron-chelating domain-containing protein [Halodesulfovibrio marinisediminis DSM 17456]